MNNRRKNVEAKAKCSVCNELKEISEFYFSANGSIDKRCKRCQSSTKKKRYLDAKNNKQYIDVKAKKCQQCKKLLDISRFPIYPPSKDNHANTCWSCKNNNEKFNNNPNKFWWRKACIQNRYKTGKITSEQLKTLFEQQDKKCYYCKTILNNPQVDHKIPRSRNGKNIIENIALTCRDCNTLKNTRTDKEFQLFLPKYAKRILATPTRVEG